MASVDLWTADYTDEVFDESITSGLVVGNDLILTTRGGTPSNAGNVRGPANGLPWVFDASTVMADPGAGKVRLNAAGTQFAFSETMSGGGSAIAWLGTIAVGDQLTLTGPTGVAQWIYQVSAIADQGAWWLVTFTIVGGSGAVAVGETIRANVIKKGTSAIVPERYANGTNYAVGAVVGFMGRTWKCIQAGSGKPPPFYSAYWTPLVGIDATSWHQDDPFMSGDDPTRGYETFWTTGTSVVSRTTTAGEFETGIGATKVVLSTLSSQRFYDRDETLVHDGEIVWVKVRAKLSAAAAGSSVNAILLTTPKDTSPEPFAANLTQTQMSVASQALSTAWATYHFWAVVPAGASRARVNITVDKLGAGGATVFIDRVETTKGNSTPWIALLPLTGWQAYGAGFVTPRYRLDNGWVEHDGLIQRSGANLAAAATLWNVPALFRPTAGAKSKWVDNSNALMRMDIPTNGNLNFPTGGIATGGYIFLDLLRWPID